VRTSSKTRGRWRQCQRKPKCGSPPERQKFSVKFLTTFLCCNCVPPIDLFWSSSLSLWAPLWCDQLFTPTFQAFHYQLGHFTCDGPFYLWWGPFICDGALLPVIGPFYAVGPLVGAFGGGLLRLWMEAAALYRTSSLWLVLY